jgi:hypothetical protein
MFALALEVDVPAVLNLAGKGVVPRLLEIARAGLPRPLCGHEFRRRAFEALPIGRRLACSRDSGYGCWRPD